MMRSSTVMVLSLVLGSHLVQAADKRTIEETFAAAAGQTVRIEIPVAELEIEATERDDVAVELRVRCRWQLNECDAAMDRLELDSRTSSRRLTLELIGHSSWKSSILQVDGLIQVPATSPLEVKMGVADLEITGQRQDLRVDIGVGKVRARLPKESVGEAFIDVGIGQVRVLGSDGQPDERRSFLVGTDVHWDDGPGKSELDIEVGVGEVTVRLD